MSKIREIHNEIVARANKTMVDNIQERLHKTLLAYVEDLDATCSRVAMRKNKIAVVKELSK